MALKLTVILAMLFGLVTYAYSTAAPAAVGPSRAWMGLQLRRAGYIKVAEVPGLGSLVTDTFELRIHTRPHYHLTARMELICRGDRIVNYAHNEFSTETPD